MGKTTPANDLVLGSAGCDLPTVKDALAAKANVNGNDADGYTPLMAASYGGCTDVARALIAAGADVNAKWHTVKGAGMNFPGLNGQTALILAAEGKPEIVKALIAAGADANAKTADGDTALMNAANSGTVETVEGLLAAGADANAQWNGNTPLDVALMNETRTSPRTGTPKQAAEIAVLLRQHGGREARRPG